jgi:hypothetical protein
MAKHKAEGSDSAWLAPMRLKEFAFGVQYEPQHSIMDHIGTISDQILRAKNSPFSSALFPFLQTLPHESRLFGSDLDSDSDTLLRITARDTILSLPVPSDNIDSLQQVATDFDEFALEPLRRIAKLTAIGRYGVLLKLTGKSKDLRHPPIERYLSDLPRANSLFIRFTKRLATDEALTRKDVEDYRNVIFTAEQSEEGDVNISIDYQQYFLPSLSASEWADRPFPRFVWAASGYFREELTRWLEESIGVAEVA